MLQLPGHAARVTIELTYPIPGKDPITGAATAKQNRLHGSMHADVIEIGAAGYVGVQLVDDDGTEHLIPWHAVGQIILGAPARHPAL